MKKVLIVEDEAVWQKTWQRSLAAKVTCIGAESIEEARLLFAENPDLDAIVLDACVPGHNPTTYPLAREFRSSFTGPMVAVSGDPLFRRELIAAGCTHECEKRDLVRKLIEIFETPAP